MNDTIKQSYSGDLGVLVFSERRTGRPTVEPERRARLREALESVLANVNDFDAHYALLNRHYHGRFPFTDTLPPEQTEAVLKDGLQGLDDEALAQLALNPVALYRLSEQICEQYPQSWWDVLRREGSRMRQQATPGEQAAGSVEVPQEELAWLSALPLPQDAKPALAPQVIAWEWEVMPAACTWQLGDRADVAEQKATIQAEWSAAGQLTIATQGFLALGEERTLEVVWQKLAGAVQVKGRSEGGSESVRLGNPDGGPPRSGDRLKVRYLWRPAQDSSRVWDVSVVLTF